MAKELDNGNSIQIEDTVVLDASGDTDFEQVVKLTKVKLKVKKFIDLSVSIEVKIGVLACFVEHSKLY